MVKNTCDWGKNGPFPRGPPLDKHQKGEDFLISTDLSLRPKKIRSKGSRSQWPDREYDCPHPGHLIRRQNKVTQRKLCLLFQTKYSFVLFFNLKVSNTEQAIPTIKHKRVWLEKVGMDHLPGTHSVLYWKEWGRCLIGIPSHKESVGQTQLFGLICTHRQVRPWVGSNPRGWSVSQGLTGTL